MLQLRPDVVTFNVCIYKTSHYENMSMQYKAIFHGSKNEKKEDNFLIFAQNIDCGYTLEPPHNLCFRAKIRK